MRLHKNTDSSNTDAQSITALSAYAPTRHIFCSGRIIHAKVDTPYHDGLLFDSTRRNVLVSGLGPARVSQSPEGKKLVHERIRNIFCFNFFFEVPYG